MTGLFFLWVLSQPEPVLTPAEQAAHSIVLMVFLIVAHLFFIAWRLGRRHRRKDLTA